MRRRTSVRFEPLSLPPPPFLAQDKCQFLTHSGHCTDFRAMPRTRRALSLSHSACVADNSPATGTPPMSPRPPETSGEQARPMETRLKVR